MTWFDAILFCNRQSKTEKVRPYYNVDEVNATKYVEGHLTAAQVSIIDEKQQPDASAWRLMDGDGDTMTSNNPIASGAIVRDQSKANSTRGLREQWAQFLDRPVWMVGGDWQCINSEKDLESAILYVSEAQDRKSRDG